MNVRSISVPIADGATESAVVDLNKVKIVGINIPAGFDGISLKFTSSPTKAGTQLAVYDDGGSEVDLVVAASRYIVPTFTDDLAALAFTKLVVAAQAGAVIITLVVKEL